MKKIKEVITERRDVFFEKDAKEIIEKLIQENPCDYYYLEQPKSCKAYRVITFHGFINDES